MSGSAPRLLASCWTSAGQAAPGVSDERSPIQMEQRMRAAVAAGWEGFGIVHADLVAFRDTHGLPALAQLARDTGIQRLELEFLGDWWTSGPRRQASDIVRGDLLEAAEVLQVPTIKIAAAMEQPPPDDRFVAELGQLAEQAREAGTRVAIEPMPFSSNVRTVEDALRVLDAVENPSAGLVLDIWHVFRADTDYANLPRVVPGESIFIVELDDGTAAPHGTLWEDTVDRRRYPGHGDFDVPRFINAVRATGFDDFWGVEIISSEHRARPIEKSLTALAESTRACFDAAKQLRDDETQP